MPQKDSGEAADVRMHLGVSPYSGGRNFRGEEDLIFESSYKDDSGNPSLRIWNCPDSSHWHLAYHDGNEFWLERKGTAAWAVWPKTSTLEDATSYLLGPVLGLLLRLRGVTCLHASAVALEGRCVVFAGSEGAGKSTTAAAFACQGHAVLSDDIVALAEREGTLYAMPAYPQLCLWPDSVNIVFGSPDALPCFSPGWDKRRLDLGDQGTRFESRPLPVGCIYLLGDRGPDPAPYLEVIQSQAALLTLVADTYGNKILDREMRAREFDVLSRLIRTVPIRRVFPNCDAARLPDLCRLIQDDFAALIDSVAIHY